MTLRRGCSRAGRRIHTAVRPQVVRSRLLSVPALFESACRRLGTALALLWLVASPVAARPLDGQFGLRGEPGEMWVEPQVSLTSIRHPELSGGLKTTTSTSRPAVTLGDGRLVVEPTGLLFSLPSRHVVRELTALWRMELPPGTDPRDLEISYELVARSGRRGRLSQTGAPDSEIGIYLRATPPTQSEDLSGEAMVEGGVVLELDLTAARFAGDYAGTLEVRVNPH